jgi:hypothetical protein
MHLFLSKFVMIFYIKLNRQHDNPSYHCPLSKTMTKTGSEAGFQTDGNEVCAVVLHPFSSPFS